MIHEALAFLKYPVRLRLPAAALILISVWLSLMVSSAGQSQQASGADPVAGRIAGLIGDGGEGQSPSPEIVDRALAAADAPDLAPADRLEILDGVAAALDDLGSVDVGAVFARREAAHLAVVGEPDLRWVELVEQRVRWLLDQSRAVEAYPLQKQAVDVAADHLGSRAPAMLPHLQLLRLTIERGGATARELRTVDRKIGQIETDDADLVAPVTMMGKRPDRPDEDAVEKVRVFYATNRQPASPRAWFGDRYFSGAVGPMRVGVAEVWVPQRSADPVARGTLWGFEIPPSRLKATVLTRIATIGDRTRFRTLLKRDAARGKEILIYIHGYNVSFSDSVRVTANLAVDLDVRGPSLAYSWPSLASVLGYWRDGAVIADPANRLAEQLQGLVGQIASDNPDARIFVLAHSMGNRVALRALAQLAAERPSTRLAGVVLASPDVPAAGYDMDAAAVATITGRLTLYASSKDLALRVSTLLNRDVRAGSPYSLSARSPGEKIDTTLDAAVAAGLSRDYLGHSDYLRGALIDLRSVMWSQVPADRRCILRPTRSYYAFQGASCALSDYSDALVTVRRLGSKERALQFAAANSQVAVSEGEARRWTRVQRLIESRF